MPMYIYISGLKLSISFFFLMGGCDIEPFNRKCLIMKF